MTYEQAQIAAQNKSRVLHKPHLGKEAEYIATDVARYRRGGKVYESMRLEDSTGCVVIAAVRDCEVKS